MTTKDNASESTEQPSDRRRSGSDRRFSFGASKWPGIAKLTEECGEVVQVSGKLMNLDGDSVVHWDGTNLRDELMLEIGDVLAAIAFIVPHCELDEHVIMRRAADKLALFERWHVEQGDKL